MRIKKTYLQIAQDQPLRIMTEIVPNKVKLFIWVGKEGLCIALNSFRSVFYLWIKLLTDLGKCYFQIQVSQT